MNHPRQREMWEGLTKTGCLSLIIFMILVVLTIGMFV